MTGPTKVTVAPIALNGATIQIGASNTFEDAISSFEFTVSNSTNTLKSVTPGVSFAYSAAPEYSLAITFAQDLATAASLQNYLLANAGQSVQVIITAAPGTTGSKVVTATVTLAAPSIFGDVDKYLDTSVTMAVSGVPVVSSKS